jgi:hypothetical protein
MHVDNFANPKSKVILVELRWWLQHSASLSGSASSVTVLRCCSVGSIFWFASQGKSKLKFTSLEGNRLGNIQLPQCHDRDSPRRWPLPNFWRRRPPAASQTSRQTLLAAQSLGADLDPGSCSFVVVLLGSSRRSHVELHRVSLSVDRPRRFGDSQSSHYSRRTLWRASRPEIRSQTTLLRYQPFVFFNFCRRHVVGDIFGTGTGSTISICRISNLASSCVGRYRSLCRF